MCATWQDGSDEILDSPLDRSTSQRLCGGAGSDKVNSNSFYVEVFLRIKGKFE